MAQTQSVWVAQPQEVGNVIYQVQSTATLYSRIDYFESLVITQTTFSASYCGATQTRASEPSL